MAAAEVLQTLASPTRTSFQPIIKQAAATKKKSKDVAFNPEQHLAFEPPKQIHMMTDLGYREDTGVSPVAASEPFRLFSQEAVENFRNEIFQADVMENCRYSGSLGACMLRGHAPKYSPFTHDAWHHPDVLAIVSKIAGIDLIPVCNYEIAHTNISVKSEDQATKERAAAASKTSNGQPVEDTSAVVGWHHDSYPFVCVVMLSDCTDMIGGETVLRTATGGVMKVRGPEMGCAVVLQGRYVTHQALRALGAQERITAVTSFRPKSPHLADDSVLNTVRGVSNLSELYYGYGRYRLEILEERIRAQLQKLRDQNSAGKRTDTRSLKRFIDDSSQFLSQMNAEIVQDEDVVPGSQPTLDFANVQTPAKPPLKTKSLL